MRRCTMGITDSKSDSEAMFATLKSLMDSRCILAASSIGKDESLKVSFCNQ